eukprot:1365829-Alexandrium_andersonii.AAC.1
MSASLVGSEMCIRDRAELETEIVEADNVETEIVEKEIVETEIKAEIAETCLLYTSDAADDM